jgi:ubiquitin-conjugating enzyme E2 S
LLIVPFPESSLNDEAGKLFMDSYEEYANRARIMTEVHALPVGKAVDDTHAGESEEAVEKLQKKKDAKKKSIKRL